MGKLGDTALALFGIVFGLAVYLILIPPFMIFIGGGPVPRACRKSETVTELLICMEAQLALDLYGVLASAFDWQAMARHAVLLCKHTLFLFDAIAKIVYEGTLGPLREEIKHFPPIFTIPKEEK